MKTKGFIIGAFAVALVLVGTGANAYVGNAGGTPSPDDFSFVNNIGTLSWTTGDGTINIDVLLSAPDDDDSNFPSGTYGSYFPDPLYGSFTASYDTVAGSSGSFSSSHDPTAGSTF